MLEKAGVSLIAAVVKKAVNLSTRFATRKEKLIGDGYNYTLYGLAQCSQELSRLDYQICFDYLARAPSFSNSAGALVSFDDITANTQEKKIALFLDYDGTLSPIVNDPERAFMSLSARSRQKPIEGATVESNIFCVSVHYRNVAEEVYKICPNIKWDKGNAVEYLLGQFGLDTPDADQKVLSIYIGDDRTDEDAFQVLRTRQIGFGIRVTQIPTKTAASYSLKDPSEVLEFLTALVRWREQWQQ
uniref:Trehalose 6-phosphate phosphatase n=1 Tax=Leersia perrieri TaxID=77586 RepID=A0A0D9XXM5_9ORYZ